MNSLRNTTVSAGDDKFYYEVVTRYWHPNLTKIIKHDFETRELEHMADIEGLQTKEPRVRFGGEKGEWIPATDFVKFTDDKPYAVFHSQSSLSLIPRKAEGRSLQTLGLSTVGRRTGDSSK